jgi:exodeoxyribonuclease VIII
MRIDLDFLKERPLSYSSIKEFAKSPKHYVYYIHNKSAPSKPMELGTLMHTLLMYPDKVSEQFLVTPDVDRRTKAGKEQWEEFIAQANGKTLISQDEMTEAIGISDIILSNWKARNTIMECNSFEQEFKIDIAGLPFRGFVDGIKDKEYVLEIKTINDASPANVTREFYNRKYHIQAGLYNLAHNLPVKYLIVETKAPYNYMLVDVADEYLKRGQEELYALADKFTTCIDLDAFNAGYGFMEETEFVLDLPSWVK